MLMSQAASSSGAATRPRFGVCASAALPTAPSARASATNRLRVDMLDLPARGNAPAGNTVEMVDGLAAAPGNQFGARRLKITGLIGGATLQHGRTAVPAPRHAEPRERHRQHR